MTENKNKDITNISYNHLNLPEVVAFTNNRSITIIYDATGVKLKKMIDDNGTILNTDYTGLMIINGTEKMMPNAEGYAEILNGSWRYVYQYKNQINNVRLSYSDLNGNGSFEPFTEILHERNYYPFRINTSWI